MYRKLCNYEHANEVIILKLELDICKVIKLINYSRIVLAPIRRNETNFMSEI